MASSENILDINALPRQEKCEKSGHHMVGLSPEKSKAVKSRQRKSRAVIGKSHMEIAKPSYDSIFFYPTDCLGVIKIRVIVHIPV